MSKQPNSVKTPEHIKKNPDAVFITVSADGMPLYKGAPANHRNNSHFAHRHTLL